MTAEEFDPLLRKYSKEILEDQSQFFNINNALSKDELELVKKLDENLSGRFKLRLGVFYKHEFIGWHFGRQDSRLQFSMQNSGILPEHRRKGLYTELVKRVLEVATAMGFQCITSQHHVTNNAVIISKLKLGFVIAALEVTDIVGTVIRLNYFPKEIRRKMTEYRDGSKRPDAEIKKYLGI